MHIDSVLYQYCSHMHTSSGGDECQRNSSQDIMVSLNDTLHGRQG